LTNFALYVNKKSFRAFDKRKKRPVKKAEKKAASSRTMALGLASVMCRRLASRLTFREFGVPCEVVNLEHFPDPELAAEAGEEDQVVVKVLAAPVHPAHINTIQGTYGIKPQLPAVGGGEGVAKVIQVGSKVTAVKVGDLVYPHPKFETWTTRLKGHQDDFRDRLVGAGVDVVSASLLRTNPGSAYRMLHDFIELGEGDLVVQNGANSHVGQAVIQIAKDMGIRTLNVVRDRPDLDALKAELMDQGADFVVTEKELRLRSSEFRSAAKLALNCVGGSSSTEISKCLGAGGVHVTYGGMSLKPVTAATSGLIFKDISFRGFWMTRWARANGRGTSEAALAMYKYLEDASRRGALRPPKHVLVPPTFEGYKEVLRESMQGFKNGKFIFDLRDEDERTSSSCK